MKPTWSMTARVFDRRQGRAGLFERQRQRFFAEDGFARAGRGDNHVGMRAGGRGDDDGVDVGSIQHGCAIARTRAPRRARPARWTAREGRDRRRRPGAPSGQDRRWSGRRSDPSDRDRPRRCASKTRPIMRADRTASPARPQDDNRLVGRTSTLCYARACRRLGPVDPAPDAAPGQTRCGRAHHRAVPGGDRPTPRRAARGDSAC